MMRRYSSMACWTVLLQRQGRRRNGMNQANDQVTSAQGSQAGRARYRPEEIEPKWQRVWLERKTFRAQIDLTKPKFYILDMSPTPARRGCTLVIRRAIPRP